MTYDIIFISSAKGKGKTLTQSAIKSLIDSKDVIDFNIVVIESQKGVKYAGATTYNYDFKFNYNKCLNLGISKTENKYIVLCNNDLIFEKRWADKLHIGFQMGFLSLSPYCKTTLGLKNTGSHIINGYQIAKHLAGWCIAVDRGIFKEIGKLNEAVVFWYSDNVYKDQIKAKKIKHGLVCNSFVTHLGGGSNTLKTLDKNKMSFYTKKQRIKYLSNF